MPEEWPQCLGNREHELAVRKIKEHVVGQVLGKQQCPLLTTGRTQVESLAAERSEVVVAAVWVCAPDSRHALEIVPTRAKSPSHLLDPFRPKPSVLLCVPILVLITELVEMSGEDLMELIPAARNIPRAGYLPNCD